MWKIKSHSSCGVVFQCYLILLTFWMSSCIVHAEGHVRASGSDSGSGPVVKKEERWPVVSTDYGEISAARISDGVNGSYLLHFFSLEPNSLLLPLLLNADVLFYVQAGNGKLSWSEEDEVKHMDLRRGDVCKLLQGSVFYMLSDAQQQNQLKIHAIFANSNDDLREPAATVPYSSVQDMVLGFDKKILQATFKVSEQVIDELLGGPKPPAITHVDQFCIGFSEGRSCDILETNKKKKKDKKEKEEEEKKERKDARLFNLFEEEKEIENCNGWSTTVTKKQLAALEGSNIAIFMVNLTTGSMMEPHWNAMDTEIAVVLEGRGMVRVSNPSITKETAGRNVRFEVEAGDVFVVPRFHAAAQMAFNNRSFVYMGFSRMAERNKARFIAGEDSVLQVLNKDVVAIMFNIGRTALDAILAPRRDSAISACTSCAEEEMQAMHGGGGGGRRHGRGEGKGREEESAGHHGREGEKGREEERGGGHHGGGDEEGARWRRGGDEGRREEEGRGGDEGRGEEGGGWRRGGEKERWEEEEEASRQHEREMEPERHHYEQGGRRILKRN